MQQRIELESRPLGIRRILADDWYDGPTRGIAYSGAEAYFFSRLAPGIAPLVVGDWYPRIYPQVYVLIAVDPMVADRLWTTAMKFEPVIVGPLLPLEGSLMPQPEAWNAIEQEVGDDAHLDRMVVRTALPSEPCRLLLAESIEEPRAVRNPRLVGRLCKESSTYYMALALSAWIDPFDDVMLRRDLDDLVRQHGTAAPPD